MVRKFREPGPVERVFIYKNVYNSYRCFNLTAKFSLPFTAAQLSSALKKLVDGTPWLTNTIFHFEDVPPGADEYKVGAVKSIKFSEIVTFVKVDAFDDKVLDVISNLHIPFDDETLPLWRVRVSETADGAQYLTLYFDHALYDGMSGVHMLQEIARHFSTDESPAPVDYVYEEPQGSTDTPLAARELHPWLNPTLFDRVLFYWKFSAPKYLHDIYNAFCGALYPMMPDFTKNPPFDLHQEVPGTDTRTVSFRLAPPELDSLLRFCRDNKLTITPLLQVVFVQTLEEVVAPQIAPPTKFSTAVCVAINYRKCLPQTDGFQCGMLTTLDLMQMPPMSGRFKTYVQTIQERYNKNAAANHAHMARVVAFNKFATVDRAKALAQSAARLTCVVSNLGAIPDPGYKYGIEDMIFAQNVGRKSFFSICSATTANGGMNVVVSYVSQLDEVVDGVGPVMAGFSREMRSRILRLATGTSASTDFPG